MAIRRHTTLTIVLALLLLAGPLAPMVRAQGPADPWLLRVLCPDEEAFQALLASGARIVLWWDGEAYALADADQRASLAEAGLGSPVLDYQPSTGRYYTIWEFADAAEALRLQYGTLVDLGDGFYLLGLPPGVELGEGDGPRYAHPLPMEMVAPLPASTAVLNPPSPPPLLADVVGAVSQERLTGYIKALQDDANTPGEDAYGSRYVLDPGLDVAADYIQGQLEDAGLSVVRQPFFYGRTVNNIIATLPGQRPESDGVLVVCAHYDSTAGTSPGWADNWRNMAAPGADDNGSGTAAVLEAARVLAQSHPVYTIRFVLFAAEEEGTRGSEAYVDTLAATGANILGAINMDMIGYDANEDGAVEVHTGCGLASQALGDVLVRNMRCFSPSLDPDVKDAYANDISDQSAFWSRGYPAILIIEDSGQDFNFTYHSVKDTLHAMNTGYLTAITRAVVGALGELAQLRPPPDLSGSHKEARYDPAGGGTIDYTVTLQNSGETDAGATLTDILPAQLRFSGTPAASAGDAVWDEAGHCLRWAGVVPARGAVVVHYQATLSPSLLGSLIVRHSAYVDDGTGLTTEMPADVKIPWRFPLPLIRRAD